MKRKIELFTAGCPVCEDAAHLVRSLICESCELEVLNTVTDRDAQDRAKEYGLTRLPAVVVTGRVADCCSGTINAETLRGFGVGVRA